LARCARTGQGTLWLDFYFLEKGAAIINASGKAICPYCGVGCQVKLTVKDNLITELSGAKDSPVNRGRLCPKGALLSPVLGLPGRLLNPQVRPSRASGFVDLPWSEALTQVAQRLREIIDQYGPDSVALYGSGQLDTEGWYVGNKLFKGFVGSNHVDSNSRLCMASAVVAYRTTLGSDGPPTTYDDINHADCFLVAGSNMADTHPVVFQQLKARLRDKKKPTLIVVDPRYTHTAQAAGIHIPLRPGSDIAFFNLIALIAIRRNAADTSFIQNHTTGFDDYLALIHSLDANTLAEQCGVPLDVIESAADAIIKSRALLSFYCMGLGQSSVGTAKNQAIIDLHLLLGQIGKPGAGPFSLTGQPNAMGGRELGGLAQFLPGYRVIENDAHRHEMERLWNLPTGSIHPKAGLTAVEIFQGLEAGRIKAVWIVCNNPMVSMPNLAQTQRALANAELVIVQDCFETETTRVADVIFPAAQWIEKTGTMTNSERRVMRTSQMATPPGQAKPDWWIFSHMARALGYSGFDFESCEQIWDEYRALTAGRPCDQYGITNERLQTEAIQWPCPTENHPGTPRRYLDKKFATPDGRARFVVCHHKPPLELPSEAYPFMLTTGRLASQWHTMTRTGKIQRLARQAPAPYVEINPVDAKVQNISEGDLINVSSLRGQVTVAAKISVRVMSGVVFMPFHWGDLYAPGNAANQITNDVFDPISKQPEYKACAVAIAKAIDFVGSLENAQPASADKLFPLKIRRGVGDNA
jgi:ferredoxin-nitrate reductase